MRRYPEYKESGVEWIGEMTACSEATRLKYICELIVDCEHKTAPTQETGYPLIRTPNIGIGYLMLDGVNRVSEEIYQEWSRRTIPQAEDLILAREAPVGNVAIIPKNMKVCLGQRTVLIRPDKDKVCPMFLIYLMLGDEIQARLLGRSTGATVHHLNMTDIRNLELPRLPLLLTQRKIADFLDRKTGQIDELLRIKGRRIELLQEQRTTLINQAVTKGLDPNVGMKPSGVEFIGEIPAHWESKRLAHVSTIFKGGTPKRNVDRYFQGDLPWARPVDITALQGALYIHDTEIHISEEALGNSGARRLPPGTVLLTSRATIGETAITTVPMATNQGFANFVCNEQLLNIYLTYYLRAIKDLLISLGNGSTFLEVTKGTLVGVGIPLPPLPEQKQIVDFLEQKNKQIDELISEEQRKIELLKEYRQSLISEAVTGKIDIRSEV